MFSSSTQTTGSPSRPKSRARTWVITRSRTASSSSPLAFATRDTWYSADAGLMCGSRPLADAVTEESLAKVVFDTLPDPLPPIGELAEVTVALAAQPARPALANASIQRLDGRLGVWVVEDDTLRFAPVKLGAADLDGRTQVLDGLKAGERVVLYSQKALTANSRFKVVDSLPGVSKGAAP